MKVNEQNNSPEQNCKRQYVTPKVFVYGNITEVTKNVGTTGAADGAPPTNNKTV